MKALLIVAHGSRNTLGNDEIALLANTVGQSDSGYAVITHAFLEIAEPDIATTISDLSAKGMREIKVLPYFLAMGNHVARDVPEIIEQARTDHPHISFEVTEHIGAAEGIAEMITNHIG